MDEDRLQAARAAISGIDREMARLFEQRMETVRQIADYKRARGLPILDAVQERVVIERNLGFLENDALRSYYVSFIQGVMDVSKQYQRDLLQGIRVACCGGAGNFAQIAAQRIFPEGEIVACPDLQAAYQAVERGDCDFCVLPLENGSAGEVGQVTDLMVEGPLCVTGVYALPVTHHLLGLPGAALKDITRVVGQPQALSQCAAYLRGQGLETIPAPDSAQAAQTVRGRGDPTLACIASVEAARLYGLQVLARAINDSGLNATRFALFARAEKGRVPKTAGFLLLFTVKHGTGTLATALEIIGRYGFNARVLGARPLKDMPGQYFLAELEGDDREEASQRMLEALKAHCDVLKVAGRFPGEIVLREEEP